MSTSALLSKCINSLRDDLMMGTVLNGSIGTYIQEIKFEPNVMCEIIDKKLTFRSSQVCQYTSIQRDV